jgi:hypothetical protein
MMRNVRAGPPPAALDVARVERTLLSVAFDVDFDFDSTLIRRGCPIFLVFCERWEPRKPAAPFLKLMSLLILKDSYQGMPLGIPKADTTVEERRLSAA